MRVASFTARRARAFAIVLGPGLLLGVLVSLDACSSSSGEPPLQLVDASPSPPPGACVVTPSPTALCEAGAPPPAPQDGGVDADASDDADAGDAGPAYDAGPLPPPESGNTCLVTSDTSIMCPSVVAGLTSAQGRAEATDVVITQRRVGHVNEHALFVNDTHADVQHLHLDGHSGGIATLDPIPPYEVSVDAPQTAPRLTALGGGASSDPSLVVMTADQAATTTTLKTGHLVSGAPVTLGAPLDLPGAFAGPSFVTSSTGEGMALLAPRAGNLVLLRGLPDAPRSVPTNITSLAFALTIDPSGNPAGLFSVDAKWKLLEGDGFATERWSQSIPSSSDPNGGGLDVVYVGTVPAVLVQNRIQVLDSGNTAGAYAVLGNSFSTCTRTTYVGLTCDACPTAEHCQTGEDDIRTARLFTRDGRLFAIYYSTDVRRTMGFSLDKSPIFGLGCVCAIHERDKQEYADSLVVVELTAPASPGGPPTVVEQMRLPIYKARTTGFVSLTPRSDGDVDVIVGGGATASFQSPLTELPKQPSTFRALRISTRALTR